MFGMIRIRRLLEWRYESGPGYDIRQYHNGTPTGLVAATALRDLDDKRPGVVQISGHDVQLIIELSWITVVERCAPGRGGVWLKVPFRSCVDASVHDEPGLAGAAMVRLDLTVRIGPDATVTVPLWFAAERRPQLHQLARQLLDHPEPDSVAPTPPLPVLDVEQAPNSGDWVVFRAHPSSTEVLRDRPAPVADEFLARRNGETL